MRAAFIAAIAVVTALAAIWSANVITVASPKLNRSASAASSIDAMQMMKNAKIFQWSSTTRIENKQLETSIDKWEKTTVSQRK